MSAPDPRTDTPLTPRTGAGFTGAGFAEAARWSKSSRSANNGACVEVAFAPDLVATRDSKDPAGPALVFGAAAWTAFVAAVKNGDHDRG